MKDEFFSGDTGVEGTRVVGEKFASGFGDGC
jgi:hypothetical protein